MGRPKGSRNGTRNPTMSDIKKVYLVSYEMKAVIPTGMYANIQPCIIVEAETLEDAERVVMPHIERLFAKYREGQGALNVKTVARQPEIVENPANPKEVTFIPSNTVKELSNRQPDATQDVPVEVQQTITLTVPFTRASSAINSCMSLEALQLVADQVERSEKLIDSEKVDLRIFIAAKREALTTPVDTAE